MVFIGGVEMLLMLQCLDQAARIDPGSPRLHVCRVKFLKFCTPSSLRLIVHLHHVDGENVQWLQLRNTDRKKEVEQWVN
jgi:hypothetical protein